MAVVVLQLFVYLHPYIAAPHHYRRLLSLLVHTGAHRFVHKVIKFVSSTICVAGTADGWSANRSNHTVKTSISSRI
jgi:hypothetical protein